VDCQFELDAGGRTDVKREAEADVAVDSQGDADGNSGCVSGLDPRRVSWTD
jgi:hypothetical protein